MNYLCQLHQKNLVDDDKSVKKSPFYMYKSIEEDFYNCFSIRIRIYGCSSRISWWNELKKYKYIL